MRAWIALLLLPLAGCVEEVPTEAPEPTLPNLGAYIFWMDSDVGMSNDATDEISLDFMVRVTNHENFTVNYTFMVSHLRYGQLGPVTDSGWQSQESNHDASNQSIEDTLAGGQSRLWIMQGSVYDCHCVSIHLLADGQEVYSELKTTKDGGGQRSPAGTHVQTVTVGVWANGTSFYTNDALMLSDPAFPAGGHINRIQAIAESAPLPIYIYETDRTDQPPASRDQCYFTTIPGYNALLKQQTDGATGVRFLTPEEGYTRAGNEAHFLYGEPLIFMNAIVAVDGPVAITDGPDMSGACFDQQNTIDYVSERAPL